VRLYLRHLQHAFVDGGISDKDRPTDNAGDADADADATEDAVSCCSHELLIGLAAIYHSSCISFLAYLHHLVGLPGWLVD
jgi:hypothetical protein